MSRCKSTVGQEKDTIAKMVRLYCRKNHGSKHELCGECRELLDYAANKLDKCRFGNDKPTCGKCTVHCYKSDMREKVKKVMRFAGPRMLLVHPVDAVRHLLKEKGKG